jgi:hypothetical protein
MRPGTDDSCGTTPAGVGQRDAERTQRANHRQQVADVVAADQLAVHRQRDAALDQIECQGVALVAHVARREPCLVVQRIGPQVGRAGVHRQLGGQRGALLVVDVDHCGAQPWPAEQRALGCPVGGHVAVVVEVVLREIGELRHRDARAREALVDQADRRRLHRAPGEAARDEAGERGLQHHRVGRGQAGGQQRRAGGAGAWRFADTERADHAAAPPERAQRLGGPPRHRGLAVGAGDSHHIERVAGLAVPRIGDHARLRLQRRRAGDALRIEFERVDTLELDQAARRARGQRCGDMAAAVIARARPGQERIAAAHAPAVGAQRARAGGAQP